MILRVQSAICQFILNLLIGYWLLPPGVELKDSFTIQEWTAIAKLIENYDGRIYETRMLNAPGGNAGLVVLAQHYPAWSLFVFTRGLES